MGSATAGRCISLFPLLLFPRPSSLRLLRHFSTHRSPLFLSPPHSLSLFLSPPKLSQQLHTQPLSWGDNTETHFSSFPEASRKASHPWFEWLDFTHCLSLCGYSNGSILVDDFVDDLELPLDFLRAAHACLAFARHFPNLLWSLPREDIEVVITSGSPFLFKDASGASTRMKSFLGSAPNDVLESDRPSTVDLMKFLVSYARMAIVSSEKMSAYSRVESSTRKLFSELAKSGGISVECVSSVEKRFPEGNGQAPSSFGKNIGMKRGDWICSRCSFMNFAKNSKCLQCEEPRPKRYLTGGEWECPECNFCNFSRNVVCLRCDCKKPVTNPFQSPNSVSGLVDDTSSVKVNREENLAATEEKQQSWFTKLAQLEKSSDMGSDIADKDFPEIKQAGKDRFSLSTRSSSIDRNSDCGSLQTPSADSNINMRISQFLDEAIGKKSSTPITTNTGGNRGGVDLSVISNEKPPGQIGDGENEQAEKSEGWFKKVSELYDVKDRPNTTSDEDFPEIMPMRKGENRFVVSKKKDRSLTSPMYKRRMAMEQAGNNNYVPFVPFPPGYFAQDKPKEVSEHSTNTTSNDNSGMSSTADQHSGAISSNAGGSGEAKEVGALNPVYNASDNVDLTSKSSDSQFRNSSLDCYPKTVSPGSSENQRARDVWKGRSLEGSAVKEPDPLDMSEEAKAERWFRRVAQIKDISELSQIPDEDFPSIMPMRKGVNRFVVSKRKTPLERRLTSSQHRRNFPVVNSDPVKKENDSS